MSHQPACSEFSILTYAASRTAICRGAVFKGFLDGLGTEADSPLNCDALDTPIKITSTIARASFGVSMREAWNGEKHLVEDRCWDEDELKWKAKNQMRWYLKKV